MSKEWESINDSQMDERFAHGVMPLVFGAPCPCSWGYVPLQLIFLIKKQKKLRETYSFSK